MKEGGAADEVEGAEGQSEGPASESGDGIDMQQSSMIEHMSYEVGLAQ